MTTWFHVGSVSPPGILLALTGMTTWFHVGSVSLESSGILYTPGIFYARRFQSLHGQVPPVPDSVGISSRILPLAGTRRHVVGHVSCSVRAVNVLRERTKGLVGPLLTKRESIRCFLESRATQRGKKTKEKIA